VKNFILFLKIKVMETSENDDDGNDGDDVEKNRKYILEEYIRLFEVESSFDGHSYSPKNVSFSPKLNLIKVNTIFSVMDLKQKQFKLNLDGQKEMYLTEIRERVEEKIIKDLKRNNKLIEKQSSSSSSPPFVFFSASTSASTSASKNRKCKCILYIIFLYYIIYILRNRLRYY
jgi:hypothetical protein